MWAVSGQFSQVLSDSGDTVSRMDDVDQRILAIERQTWRRPGAKENAVREQLDLSPVRYYARLNRLLDDPAAAIAEPLLIGRLRRLRDQRTRQRRAS